MAGGSGVLTNDTDFTGLVVRVKNPSAFVNCKVPFHRPRDGTSQASHPQLPHLSGFPRYDESGRAGGSLPPGPIPRGRALLPGLGKERREREGDSSLLHLPSNLNRRISRHPHLHGVSQLRHCVSAQMTSLATCLLSCVRPKARGVF